MFEMSEQLRKLASKLRTMAGEADSAKNVKCAQVIQASIGLQMLRNKLGGTR